MVAVAMADSFLGASDEVDVEALGLVSLAETFESSQAVVWRIDCC